MLEIRPIRAEELVFLDEELPREIFSITPVYANTNDQRNIFGQVYKPDVRMLGHKQFVLLLRSVGSFCFKQYGWTLAVLDCLRTVEAQVKMSEAAEIPPSLLSRPGGGGHARGLAVDVHPHLNGKPVNFGSHFDDFTESGRERSHRHFTSFGACSDEVLANRRRLDIAFEVASEQHDLPIMGLKTEWWDYRVPNSITNSIPAVRDCDLPPSKRLTV